jgi:hypothetical protein
MDKKQCLHNIEITEQISVLVEKNGAPLRCVVCVDVFEVLVNWKIPYF